MLTYFVVGVSLLQNTDNTFKWKHPPAMHGTVSEKEFVKVEAGVVVWPPRMARKDVSNTLQVGRHVFSVLLSVAR